LIQELQAINIQMRIITEDNIDQIESMSFSRNIENLSGTMAANVIKNTIQAKIDAKKDDGSVEMTSPTSPDFGTPDYSTPAPPPEPELMGSQEMASVGYPPISYDVGVIVQYKGDGLNYTIVNSGGDNMLATIQNENGETKLVNKTELYAPIFEPTSPSPLYEPTSPSLSPEVALDSTSPTGYPPSSYDVGTVVQYKGDGLIYTIVKVSDTLLTIQNENGDSKLVNRTELNAPPSPQAPAIVGGGGNNLYFTPSIIIGGTDVTKNGGTVSVDMGAASTTGSLPNASTTGSATNASATTSVPPPASEPGLFGGAVDFSRLVINKLGA